MKIKEKELEGYVEELRKIADEMGAKVRFEKGDFKGGYCLLKESKVIVINKNATVQRKVTVLSTALKELGVDQVYLSPKQREFIESMFEEQ